ncbi:uncharacterized protein Z519_09245 [Cladophialophora bantiana CBS 173.52]|uniref:NACHT domain-containing protein n=1 Tax=Cladophialophora bantiana (strain ATCC 10958 / CBS 173.52 / CDC B-1940 / NIH 8579) TaxID=1442370 RepID=A0A0D2EIB8_CLAB1|nr:uncharacterized protein Z519_09245 [Cladophialophora bantiana CBS 173.52]KIW89816.1 hypothetical protein Z519_09245 [Cladophialophora bantiana CBS 173.52]
MVRNAPAVVVSRKLDATVAIETEPYFTVPFQDTGCLGRRRCLRKLEKRLRPYSGEHRRVALVGKAGYGKTKIAAEFAFQFRLRYPNISVFWVQGASRASFERSYQKIAERAKVPQQPADENILDSVKRWLEDETKYPWLMIVDHVDNWSQLAGPDQTAANPNREGPARYIPKGTNNCVLITTRLDGFIGNLGCTRSIDVDGMTPKQAARLLRKHVQPREKNASKEISELMKELELSPLEITRAAVAISNGCLSIQEYTERFKRDNDDKTVSTRTTQILFKLIESREEELVKREKRRQGELTGESRKARASEQDAPSTFTMDILSLMCFLDPHELPRRLLLGQDPLNFTMAMSILKSFRLVEMQRSGEFSLASQVRDAARARLQLQDTEAEFRKQALALVAGALNREYRDYEELEYYHSLLPHADAVLDAYKEREPDEDDSHSLNIVRCYQHAASIQNPPGSPDEVERRIQRLKGLMRRRLADLDGDSKEEYGKLRRDVKKLEKEVQRHAYNHGLQFDSLRQSLTARQGT